MSTIAARTGPRGRTRVPAAEVAASRLFGGLARVRGHRALHPDGVVFSGTLRGEGAGIAVGGEVFDDRREQRVLVRISRGAGTPQSLPDVLGCAIRVVDAYGRGTHQDLALASARREPVARHALVPARDFLGAFYSSVLPYRIGSQVRLIGGELGCMAGGGRTRLEGLRAVVASGRGLTVRVLAASPLGPWQPAAFVSLDRVVPEAQAAGLRFNPWNTGGGIQPIGFFNGLRDSAYRGSQAASSG